MVLELLERFLVAPFGREQGHKPERRSQDWLLRPLAGSQQEFPLLYRHEPVRQSEHSGRLCLVRWCGGRRSWISLELHIPPIHRLRQLAERRTVLTVDVQEKERGTSREELISLLEQRLQQGRHRARLAAAGVAQNSGVAAEELIDSDFDGVVLEDNRRADRQRVVPGRLAVSHRRRNDLGSALHFEDPVELLVEHVERIGI